jgi:hypothetical protein
MARQMLLQQESDQVSVNQHEGSSQECSDLTVGNMFVAGAAFTMHL